MVARFSLAGLALVAVAACKPHEEPFHLPPQLPPPAEPNFAPKIRPSNAEAGTWGERYVLEAAVIPAAWLTRDRDGVSSNPDQVDAAGVQLRGAIGNFDQTVGLIAQGFRADDAAFDADGVYSFDAFVFALDGDVRTPVDPDNPGGFFLRAGGGFGLSWLDANGDRDPNAQLSAQLRLGMEFQLTPGFLLQTDFGGIVFGHPGETEAYGMFVTLGGGLVF
jgi:hypothetical protein